MKRSEAVDQLNKWFKLVEGGKFPTWAKTPGDWLMWYLETVIEMNPPYDASQDDEIDIMEWESE